MNAGSADISGLSAEATRMPLTKRHLKESTDAEPIQYMQTQSDIRLCTHRRALLVLGMVLASTLVSAQTLPEVNAAESNGTLDAGFGAGAIVITDVSGDGNNDLASAVVVQPNGKIVAAGQTINSEVFDFAFALVRYE